MRPDRERLLDHRARAGHRARVLLLDGAGRVEPDEHADVLDDGGDEAHEHGDGGGERAGDE